MTKIKTKRLNHKTVDPSRWAYRMNKLSAVQNNKPGGVHTVMERLRENKAVIVYFISLVLLLLPVAQSMACSSHNPVKLNPSTNTVSILEKVSSISTPVPKLPGCHTVQSKQSNSDRSDNEPLSAAGSVCDGDCCNDCMTSYIMNTFVSVETHYESFYLQATSFRLKPDILSIPATPPPIS